MTLVARPHQNVFAVPVDKPVAVIHILYNVDLVPDDLTPKRMGLARVVAAAVEMGFVKVDAALAVHIPLVDLRTVQIEAALAALFKVDLALLEEGLNIEIDVIAFVLAQVHQLDILGIGLAVIHILDTEEIFPRL